MSCFAPLFLALLPLTLTVAIVSLRVSASWFRLSDAQPDRPPCETGWSIFRMHRTLRLLAVLLTSACAFAQTASAPPDPYKPVLDRLQSITVIPLSSWQAHAADLAHGEDPAALNTSGWTEVKLKEDWKGSRWLITKFEVPAQLNGYSLQGASIALDLHVSSDDAIQVSVFANGSMVGAHRRGRGSADHAHPECSAGSGAGAGGASAGLRWWRLLRRELDPDRARRTADRASGQPSRPRADAPGNSFRGAAHRRLSRRQSRARAATRRGGEGHQSWRARPRRSAGLRCLAARCAKQARGAAALHEAVQHCGGRQQPH